MKKQLLFITLFYFPIWIYAQVVCDFENNTSCQWTNTDDSTTLLTYVMHTDTATANLDDQYFQKSCDGTNTALGEMALKMNLDENINYMSSVWGLGFSFSVKNDNNFPLHIRFGVIGANNVKLVMIEPVMVPALTDWTQMTALSYSESGNIGGTYGNFQILDMGDYDANNDPYQSIFENTFASLSELRIVHNQAVSYDGEIVTGSLQIDNIRALQRLSIEKKFLENIKVFPNPVRDQLFIDFPHAIKGTLTLTSVNGKRVLFQNIKTAQLELDISKIKTKGMYFLKIKTAKGTLTKKIIKT
ncbi:T9SS type A sorting domain-containing protein [uncultured Kordia sp.]|uniref:T9SS type A sorting domain-containing protein n=1 Tax=uncultured Kordia sp. TaxID=507699 RepID=UPI002613EFEB|nr:T9SS type A sorting domain-containing protein [uncultured Kordia sp.]